MKVNALLRKLEAGKGSYYADRLLGQAHYCASLCITKELDTKLLEEALTAAVEFADKNGAITKNALLAFEKTMQPMSAQCKALTVDCVGHAHIDMNWMWGYTETVSITIATFQTVLRLMKDIPGWTFAQSQASCYRIVEQYAPEMLKEIKRRIKEGRWEVTASTWVEADKNMPSGESFARHQLYTKNYLSKLLDIDIDSLTLDFEPDTFGHNINVPEISEKGGVPYYYHCRGLDVPFNIYRCQSPSGAEILCLKEFDWYNAAIEPTYFRGVPYYCQTNQVDVMLRVFGVGDHGGGPTRKDIEAMLDMQSWPIFPTIQFGTFKGYFKKIDINREKYPVVDKERNFVFTGCYTTQTRIKAGNKHGENALMQAEAFAAFAADMDKKKYHADRFAKSWEKVLFNQFHDILTGSGVIDTREYALGEYSKAFAIADSEKLSAFDAIGGALDTDALLEDNRATYKTTSEGAGVGFGVEQKTYSYPERGRGLKRAYVLFNSTVARNDVHMVDVWDWPGDTNAMIVHDINGKVLPHQIIGWDKDDDWGFWGHKHFRLAVQCAVPAYGYTTVVVDEDSGKSFPSPRRDDAQTHSPYEFSMENDFISVQISSVTGQIEAITDKKTGMDILYNGGFSVFSEDRDSWASSWVVNRYNNDAAAPTVKFMERTGTGPVRQQVRVEAAMRNSKIVYFYTLDNDSKTVAVECEIDWLEVGNNENGSIQLQYAFDAAYTPTAFTCDIPFGEIDRQSLDMDIPAQSYVMAKSGEGSAAAIFSNSKYGFRGVQNKVSITLIRSSYQPDPYPELGKHNITFHLGLAEEATLTQSKKLLHPCANYSVRQQKGTLPLESSFISVDGAQVSAIKLAEDGSGDLIVRIYDDSHKDAKVSIKPYKKVAAAKLCDSLERPLADINQESFTLTKDSVNTLRLTLA